MPENEKLGFERLLFFSDAVIAIAITLLALEIRLPDIPFSSAQLPEILLEQTPRFLAYLISFFVIGLFWKGHHRIFGHIQRYNSGLIWINLIFLFLIASVPFPTAVLGRFPGDRLAVQLYAAGMTALSIARFGLWQYAVAQKLIAPELPRQVIRLETALNLATILVFLISIGIAQRSPILAMLFWAVLFFVGLFSRLGKKTSQETGEPEPGK